ncbi:MAG: TolC family protein [Nitritalea sp.]
MSRIHLLIGLLFLGTAAHAQIPSRDTSLVLTQMQFLEWVENFHPVARQSDLLLEFGEQEVRMARGGFDPLLYGDYNNKEFRGTTYFDTREVGMIIPTWAGIELKGLFEQNSGRFLNPERTVPTDGLFAAGLSVNLGQGLLIDRRRAALRQAQIYQESTLVERRKFLNDLYLDANLAYWNWSEAHENRLVFEEGLQLAEIRFQAIKESFVQGDLPAIDTVEAYTQVLDRLYRYQDAMIEYFNAMQVVNTFLWDDELNEINLTDAILPESVLTVEIDQVANTQLRGALGRHPDIMLIDFDIAGLNVDRRWKAEQLRPIIKVNYNFLTENMGANMEVPAFFQNDYKWGINISTPLFLRRERGGLGLAKAKIDFADQRRELRFVQLETALEQAIYRFGLVEDQYRVFSANIQGLQRLLEGEKVRFELGESSLFLINAREVALFDSKVTLNDLAAKRKIAYVRMLHAAGFGFDFENALEQLD